MKIIAVVFFLPFLYLSASAVQAQSTTGGQAETFSAPPPRPGPTEAYTLKKFKDKTEKKKYKREKPIKSRNKYNPKKAAKRAKRY